MKNPRLVEEITLTVTRRRWFEAPPSERPPTRVVETTGEPLPDRPGPRRAGNVVQLPLRRAV